MAERRMRTPPLSKRRNKFCVGAAISIALIALLVLYSLFMAFGSASGKMRESSLIALLIAVKSHYSGIRLFEPFTMVTVVYTLTLFVASVVEFGMGNVSRFGISREDTW